MKSRWSCPRCGAVHVLDPLSETADFICNCGFKQRVHDGSVERGQIVCCPLCKTDDLYIQKDFPERVGMAIVALGFILATVAWAYYSPLATFGVLFAFFGIDAALFYSRKNVTVCYRCLMQLRGMRPNEAHKHFDLGIGERYRQERLRREERKRQGVEPVMPPF